VPAGAFYEDVIANVSYGSDTALFSFVVGYDTNPTRLYACEATISDGSHQLGKYRGAFGGSEDLKQLNFALGTRNYERRYWKWFSHDFMLFRVQMPGISARSPAPGHGQDFRQQSANQGIRN
jgi:hypothetical protein